MSEHELVRALEAERLRPVPPRPPRRMPGIDRAALEELLDEVARPTAHQRAAADRFEPMKGDEDALIVSARADAKPPASSPTSAVFYTDEPGNLLRENPHQMAFTLREVSGLADAT